MLAYESSTSVETTQSTEGSRLSHTRISLTLYTVIYLTETVDHAGSSIPLKAKNQTKFKLTVFIRFFPSPRQKLESMTSSFWPITQKKGGVV